MLGKVKCFVKRIILFLVVQVEIYYYNNYIIMSVASI